MFNDNMFPEFTRQGPVTPANISFLAVMQSHLRNMPYMQQWSFSLQRQIGGVLNLDLFYIGNEGTYLLGRRNINQAVPYDPANPLPVPARRPYRNFGTFINSLWDSNSNYNSFNAKLERRTDKMVFSAVYTWAKSIDFKSGAAAVGGTTGGWQGNMKNYNTRLDRGNSDFHVPHRLVASFLFHLPFGRGERFLAGGNRWANAFVGGWQFNGIAVFAKGTPFSILGTDASFLLDTAGQRADVVGYPYPSGFQPTLAKWFDTSAFKQPAPGLFGTSGRNIMIGNGPANFDLGLFKNFSLSEQARLQFRLESFNAFNHTQFGNPNPDVNSPTFGTIGWARAARVNQIAMKLLW